MIIINKKSFQRKAAHQTGVQTQDFASSVLQITTNLLTEKESVCVLCVCVLPSGHHCTEVNHL